MRFPFGKQSEPSEPRPLAEPAVSGNPVTLDLRIQHNHHSASRILIVKALAQQGVTLRDAHAVMETLLQNDSATETFPAVTDLRALMDDLAKAGIHATVVTAASAT